MDIKNLKILFYCIFNFIILSCDKDQHNDYDIYYMDLYSSTPIGISCNEFDINKKEGINKLKLSIDQKNILDIN